MFYLYSALWKMSQIQPQRQHAQPSRVWHQLGFGKSSKWPYGVGFGKSDKTISLPCWMIQRTTTTTTTTATCDSALSFMNKSTTHTQNVGNKSPCFRVRFIVSSKSPNPPTQTDTNVAAVFHTHVHTCVRSCTHTLLVVLHTHTHTHTLLVKSHTHTHTHNAR